MNDNPQTLTHSHPHTLTLSHPHTLTHHTQMMIDIQEKVIVLDEAHNMEDSAREAASLSITAVQLTEILKEIQEVCELPSTRMISIF